ncbi:sporulation protein YjcZ [Paenibacillus sp. CF384]|nr:sporulation protein YjcZ [Paenibacillus sp. CF384]
MSQFVDADRGGHGCHQGAFTSAGSILVLFILLVIVICGCGGWY